jgi:uncharacterized protein (UPF0276 family)
LLHNLLIDNRRLFDFVELPLDLYLDPARSALLDPTHKRLHEIAAAKPSLWRGAALSLGSVETSGDPGPDARDIARVRRLMQSVGAKACCEDVGFRTLSGRDLGYTEGMPRCASAARWIAARHSAAQEALGAPLLLQPSATSLGAPSADLDAASFLCELAANSDCRFVLDVRAFAHHAREAGIEPAEMAARLPRDRVAALVTSGESEKDWPLLSMLCERTDAQAIVVRRDRNLFPVDSILEAARRAAEALKNRPKRATTVCRAARPPAPIDLDDLLTLRAQQSAFIDACLDSRSDEASSGASAPPRRDLARIARHARFWHLWRERVDDLHKAKQIARFLSRGG